MKDIYSKKNTTNRKRIMARNKLITDKILFEMIQKFLVLECNNNASKLKLPKIVKFINENGYPSYRVESLRRNPAAREYIEAIKNIGNGFVEELSVTYKTLDIDSFIDNNKTRASLKRALADLDCYYRKIADSAVEIQKKFIAMSKEQEKQLDQKKILNINFQENTAKIKLLEEQIQEKEKEVLKLRSIINDYVYPEIANALLAQEGLLLKPKNVINLEKLNKNIITADSDITTAEIKSGSFIISDLYNQLKDENDE